eukprot:3451009-Prymnesium_polylepis.1
MPGSRHAEAARRRVDRLAQPACGRPTPCARARLDRRSVSRFLRGSGSASVHGVASSSPRVPLLQLGPVFSCCPQTILLLEWSSLEGAVSREALLGAAVVAAAQACPQGASQ